MSMPTTKSDRNMYDMLSLLQKAIRRGYYKEAAYAANELETIFRSVLWSRLIVVSAEDCFGILTKEIMVLKEKDDNKKDNSNIAKAIALMCKSLKSRDACYFACNFVAANRKPREIKVTEEEIEEYLINFGESDECYDTCGFKQMSLFDKKDDNDDIRKVIELHKALTHRDMDMIGYIMNELRVDKRKLLWKAFEYYAKDKLKCEINSLRKADDFVNRNRKNNERDEIFTGKAAMLLCYSEDESIGDIRATDIIDTDMYIDWSIYNIKPISECELDKIPEWVFDCHTLKGKRMGKTDWDMTVAEQEALTPKKYAYFDDSSWAYTYQDDYDNGRESYEHMIPIWEYGKTHEVNPIQFIPY